MKQGQIDYLVTVGQISWVSSFVTNSTLLREKQKNVAFFILIVFKRLDFAFGACKLPEKTQRCQQGFNRLTQVCTCMGEMSHKSVIMVEKALFLLFFVLFTAFEISSSSVWSGLTPENRSWLERQRCRCHIHFHISYIPNFSNLPSQRHTLQRPSPKDDVKFSSPRKF